MSNRKVKTVLYVGLAIKKQFCTAKTKQSDQPLKAHNGQEKCFTYPKNWCYDFEAQAKYVVCAIIEQVRILFAKIRKHSIEIALLWLWLLEATQWYIQNRNFAIVQTRQHHSQVRAPRISLLWPKYKASHNHGSRKYKWVAFGNLLNLCFNLSDISFLLLK